MLEDFLNTPFLFRRRGSSFNPASLFGASDTGWLEPMTIGTNGTLFQDAAGTTPVTAPGQPVGLSLDSSKGLVLGPELVTNDSQFTLSQATIDGLIITASSAAYNTFASTPPFSAELSYKVTFRYSFTSGGSLTFHFQNRIINLAGSGVFSQIFVGVPSASTGLFFRSEGSGWVGTIDNISVRELPGNHFVQPTALNRPIYQVDAQGHGYLSHNGSNQWMSTSAFAWGSDKATIVAGVRKLSDAATAILLESSPSFPSNAGSFFVAAPGDSSTLRFSSSSRGSAAGLTSQRASLYTGLAPITAILTATHDIAGDLSTLRLNGVAGDNGTGDKGTGNYGTYALYAGARGGMSLFFNGNRYPSMGINRLLTAGELEKVETWVNERTGAY